MIEKLIAIYFLLVAANIAVTRNSHLLTAEQLIRLISRLSGVKVWFTVEYRVEYQTVTKLKEVYIHNHQMQRIRLEKMFDRNDLDSWDYQPPTNDNITQQRLKDFSTLAGETFREFLIDNPHVVHVKKNVHRPDYLKEEVWEAEMWLYASEPLKFKNA